MERIVFLTGRLAQASLERVLASMDAPFAWEVREIGLQVAGLMTADLMRDHAQKMKRVRLIRFGPENALIDFSGRFQPTALVVLNCLR